MSTPASGSRSSAERAAPNAQENCDNSFMLNGLRQTVNEQDWSRLQGDEGLGTVVTIGLDKHCNQTVAGCVNNAAGGPKSTPRGLGLYNQVLAPQRVSASD